MQPDLPEPVVPATSTCGISARSAETAWPETSLPSQRDQRRRSLRPFGVDVAESYQAPALVGDLDPDRLLAGDRGEDADVGRGQRVGEVVAKLGHLGDLGPGRELELVAAHVRAADGAEQPRFDPEMPQRLEQRLRGRLAIAGIRARVGLAALERLRRRRAVGDLVRGGDPTFWRLLPIGVRSTSCRGRRFGSSPPTRCSALGARCSAASSSDSSAHAWSPRPRPSRPRRRARRSIGSVGSGAGHRDLVPGRVAPGSAAASSRCVRTVRATSRGTGPGPANRPPGRAEEAGDGGAGDQQGARDQHQHREDVGPEALKEGRRGPVERLTDGAAMLDHEPLLEEIVAVRSRGPEPGRLGCKREQERGEHQDPAGIERRRARSRGRAIRAPPQAVSAIGTT